MWRTALGALVGMLLGIGCTALLLYLTNRVIARMTAPQEFEIEYGAIYLTITLGAGFGAVCGALAGLTSAVLRAWRDSRQTPVS